MGNFSEHHADRVDQIFGLAEDLKKDWPSPDSGEPIDKYNVNLRIRTLEIIKRKVESLLKELKDLKTFPVDSE